MLFVCVVIVQLVSFLLLFLGTESIQLFASNDLRNILLVKGHRSIYLWEIDQPESALRLREMELKGTWSLIGGDKAPLPGADSAEAVSDAVFMNDPVRDLCLALESGGC